VQEVSVSAVVSTQPLSLVATSDRVDDEHTPRHAACRAVCSFAADAPWHHARLTAMESDQDAVLELFELALTWHELEYAESQVIPPDQWMAFIDDHRWTDPDRIERIVSIATDVVRSVERTARPCVQP
jgi:hypothetical protein